MCTSKVIDIYYLPIILMFPYRHFGTLLRCTTRLHRIENKLRNVRKRFTSERMEREISSDISIAEDIDSDLRTTGLNVSTTIFIRCVHQASH